VAQRPCEYKGKENAILLPLYDIIGLDEARQTVTVEPLVTIGQLTHFLVPKGWTLAIVPELDDLTVGGLLLGYGIESTSHKYGLFTDIVSSVDIILGDGSLVHATPDNEYADLFRALPWSHGALGFVVAMEIQIVKCKKYCRLVYEPVTSMQQMCDRFTEVATMENPPEFLEGLQFSYDRGVLTYGDFSDKVEKDGFYNPIGWWFKSWYVASAGQSRASKA
ncbi:Delta(24)-sterol reductase, partial [Quaeritorhiza haematococci]